MTLFCLIWLVKCIQVTFIYIVLLTIQIVSKQLYSITVFTVLNRKIVSIMQKDNSKHSIFS